MITINMPLNILQQLLIITPRHMLLTMLGMTIKPLTMLTWRMAISLKLKIIMNMLQSIMLSITLSITTSILNTNNNYLLNYRKAQNKKDFEPFH
jgi:hypothetical protein